MEQNNLYKKLRFIALCLAIICMVLSLIKKAHAKVPDYVKEYSLQFYNNYSFTSEQQAVIDSIYNNYNYLYIVEGTGNYHTLDNFLIFSKSKLVGFGCDSSTTSSSTSVSSIYFASSDGIGGFVFDSIQNNNDMDLCIINFFDDHSMYITDTYNTGSYYFMGNSQYKYPSYNSRSYSNLFNYYSTRKSIPYNNPNFTYTFHYQEDGNFFRCQRATSTSYTFFRGFDTFSNTELIVDNTPQVNTDGLKVYKQTIHNQSFLYIDYSDLQNIAPTYLETSSVFGNIDVDGTIFEIDYDSTSPYYHINLSTGKVYYQIPFGSLDIDDETIDSAILTDLEINVSWSTTLNNGENDYFWVTPIYLIGTPHNVDGYTPDSSNEQPAQTYTPEMNAEYYLNIYSMYYNGHTGDPFIYNDNINLFSSHQNALDSIKLLADVLEIDTWYTSSTNKELWASNTDLFGDYIYDNGFGLYYDAIVFDVYDRHVDGVINPVNEYKGTGVLLTERYYTRNGLMTCTDSLKDIINYDRMCSDYLYLLYDVTWKKLKSIDYNTSDYFTKQGTLTNQIIMLLENINSFLPDINGLLNDILDALKNLQLSQLDAIDDKLSTIVDNMTGAQPFNEDDTIAEAIAYYTTHTQTEAVVQDKYSVWFTGYCHYWLQEYNTQQTRNITVDTSVSDNRRKYIVKTFTFCERAFNSLENADVLKYIDEMFQYLMVQHNNPNAEPRKHFFEDIFDTTNYSTLDYNPYE